MLCQFAEITAYMAVNTSNSVPGPAPALVLAGRNRADCNSLVSNHLRARGAPKSLILRDLRSPLVASEASVIFVRAVTSSSQGICVRVHIVAEVILAGFAVEAVAVVVVIILLVVGVFAHVVAVRVADEFLLLLAQLVQPSRIGVVEFLASHAGEADDFVVGGGGGHIHG